MHDWQDWESAQIETELLIEQERREKENSAPPAPGESSNVGCASIALYIFLGIIIFKIFVGFVSILSR
jgi:hypothetical protein